MTGITKLEASILWGNGFKLQDKEGKQWDITRVSPDWIDISRFEGGLYEQVIFPDQIGTDYFIICHSLDKLTQPIMHEGKEITPIVELGKKVGHNDIEPSEIDGVISYGWNEQSMDDVQGFEFNFCEKKQCLGVWYDTKDDSGPIYTLGGANEIAYMNSLHFDRFGWAERGLTTPK